VVVVGTSGCGKSTLAARLSERLDAPHIELDALYWGPGWTPRPEAEFRRRIAEAIAGDRWIVDGNYGVARALVWPQATTVVWMNYNFVTVMRRVITRTIRRSLRREPLYSDNRESLGRAIGTRESIVWWALTTYARRRRNYGALRAERAYPQLRWIELRRPRDAEAWLASITPR
jgi:adenylate kinase family enzyme